MISRRLGVGGDGAFRHLQLQRARRDQRAGQKFGEAILQAGIRKLAAREIDADEQRLGKREKALPMRKILGRPLQRQAAERDDQARSPRNGR